MILDRWVARPLQKLLGRGGSAGAWASACLTQPTGISLEGLECDGLHLISVGGVVLGLQLWLKLLMRRQALLSFRMSCGLASAGGAVGLYWWAVRALRTEAARWRATEAERQRDKAAAVGSAAALAAADRPAGCDADRRLQLAAIDQLLDRMPLPHWKGSEAAATAVHLVELLTAREPQGEWGSPAEDYGASNGDDGLTVGPRSKSLEALVRLFVQVRIFLVTDIPRSLLMRATSGSRHAVEMCHIKRGRRLRLPSDSQAESSELPELEAAVEAALKAR